MDANPLQNPVLPRPTLKPPEREIGVAWPHELARAHHRRSRDLPWKSLHHRYPSACRRDTRQRGGRPESGGDRTELPFDQPRVQCERPCATRRSWRRSGWWLSPDEADGVRFKLDENLPVELASLLRRSGHDAATVLDQGLGGARDPELASVCAVIACAIEAAAFSRRDADSSCRAATVSNTPRCDSAMLRIQSS